jgi:alpha-beta hydrolase superfamily lysophospholipase
MMGFIGTFRALCARSHVMVSGGGTGRTARRVAAIGLAVLAGLAAARPPAEPQARDTLVLRGHPQSLYLYGKPDGAPVIVSSGDGGWLHLAPHVAELLAARGYFVVGFDVKAYLESFTSDRSTLSPADEPGDYRVLADYARAASGRTPVLVGVSEGAGLSVLAAGDPATKRAIEGVIVLGLPDVNELAWRWKDAIIYLTHRPPHEPTFSAASVIGLVSPLPLAAIHSTHDEFSPPEEIARLVGAAGEPKRLWMIEAADHGFSGNLAEFDRRLLDALQWVDDNRTPSP